MYNIIWIKDLRMYVAELQNLVNDVNIHARGILLANLVITLSVVRGG